jgi:acyl carrier protein
MSQATLTALRALIVERFDVPVDTLDNEAAFTTLGLDSLGLVDFMFQVEDRFHVVIDYDQAMAQPTLLGLTQLVDRLRGQAVKGQAA